MLSPRSTRTSTPARRARSRSCASWCACPPTRRPATTRPRRAHGGAARSDGLPGRAASGAGGRGRGRGSRSVTNLIVRRRFGDGPVIALNAHGDVVPPGDGWTRPPYDGVIEDGRMYGRGVAVSKSDFATYTFALRALETAARERAPRSRARSSCTSPTTRSSAARSGPAGCCATGSRGPTSRSAPGSRTRSSPRTTAACNSRSRCTGGGARGDARDRRRRAARRRVRSSTALYALEPAYAQRPLEGRGHRLADDQRRPHRGRHEHQRRAGEGGAEARPAHDSRGGCRPRSRRSCAR